jgi:hypothetical protein
LGFRVRANEAGKNQTISGGSKELHDLIRNFSPGAAAPYQRKASPAKASYQIDFLSGLGMSGARVGEEIVFDGFILKGRLGFRVV